jgi:hypothetical protein
MVDRVEDSPLEALRAITGNRANRNTRTDIVKDKNIEATRCEDGIIGMQPSKMQFKPSALGFIGSPRV